MELLLQSFVRDVKFRYCDNGINKMRVLKYFREVIKHVNERGGEHEIQTNKKVAHGVSTGIKLDQKMSHAE